MIYTFKCSECGSVFEIMQGMDDVDVVERCDNPDCQMPMTRRHNRLWGADPVTLHTNCTGGGGAMQWEGYYDPGLGTEIQSKEHRSDLMKRRDLQDYAPDPAVQKHVDEAEYIRSRSRMGDTEAAVEMDKSVKAAAKVQRERNINAVFDASNVA